jgi:hypothetical protein
MLKLFGKPNEVDDGKLDLNTRVTPHIRIINGALDESSDSSSALILNGRIDPATLHFLKVDNEYQRALADRSDIFNALKEGSIVPNIEVGVRGQDFTTEGDDFLIHSPAYIIDGWQRIGNALRLLQLVPDQPLRIFASVHFGTSLEWERHRFTELNKNTKRISPNLHLRNMRNTNEAVLTLYGLSNTDRNFPLYKKISWSQNAQRGEIISALALAVAIHLLHGHRGGFHGRRVEFMAAGLARIVSAVTLPTFRRNVSTYVSLINECWPFAAIEYRAKAPQVKSTFLNEVARMLSRHACFWEHNDNTLVVGADDRRKLSKFPINDPQVLQLAGSGGAARNILYSLLIDHMNSGRRTQRLRPRSESDA